MYSYRHFPRSLSGALTESKAEAALENFLNDRVPHGYLDVLALHPALLSKLLLEDSLPFQLFNHRPNLTVPAFIAAQDKLAFASLLAPHLSHMPEGMAVEYIWTARVHGIPDVLLQTALARVKSPWRLKVLGYNKLAAKSRTENAMDLSVSLSSYIESGAFLKAPQFELAKHLDDEDLFRYIEARLADGLPIDAGLLDGLSGCLAYNMVAACDQGTVNLSRLHAGAYIGIMRALQDDQVWAVEYFMTRHPKGSGMSVAAGHDLSFWVSDAGFGKVQNELVREEMVGLFVGLGVLANA